MCRAADELAVHHRTLNVYTCVSVQLVIVFISLLVIPSHPSNLGMSTIQFLYPALYTMETVITTDDGHQIVAEMFGYLNIAMASEVQSISSIDIYPSHTGLYSVIHVCC